MASFHGARFPRPMFNQNFPPNNLNSGADRHPPPQFQRPPNAPYRPFQPPERFMHEFQNRPHFSNFPETMSTGNFLQRPPPPMPPTHPHQALHMNSSSFIPPSGPPPARPQHLGFSQSGPPHPGHLHAGPPQFGVPNAGSLHSGPPPVGSSHPRPPNFGSSHPGPPNFGSHSGSLNVGPSHPGPPNVGPSYSGHLHSGPSHCAPLHTGPSHSAPLHTGPSNSGPPHAGPPQFRVPHIGSLQSGPSNVGHLQIRAPVHEHPPPPFVDTACPGSPHPATPSPRLSNPGLRFTNSFAHPARSWNKMPVFERPRVPFKNRFQAPLSPHKSKDLPLQMNRKRKQKTREFRKLKDDGTEKPFSCDTCDRAFVTENELNDHISQHIQCDHTNCTFEAHPKIVALHKKMQHDTGYADRINSLKDDAEVKKWREERRRRFPTAENIRKRQAEQAEREARGEVLETKEFGKFKRRAEENGSVTKGYGRRKKWQHVRRTRERNFQSHPCSRPFTIKIDSESDSDSDSHIKLNRFLGLSSLANSVSEKCYENEDIEVTSNPHNSSEAVSEQHQFSCQSSWKQNLPKSGTTNNISQPIVLYSDNSTNGKNETSLLLNGENLSDCAKPVDSSVCEIPENEIEKPRTELVVVEDSDDEGPEVLSIIKCTEKAVSNNDSQAVQSVTHSIKAAESEYQEDATNDFLDVPSATNSVKATKLENDVNVTYGSEPRRQRSKEKTNLNGLCQAQNPAFQPRKSLLEKLLADDIRHERNVVLQCIRHIVNNNFFGIGAKKS